MSANRKNIIFSDITLRETASLSFRERLETAKQLDALCFDVIETAPVNEPKADLLLLRTMAPQIRNSILSAPVGMTLEEADAVAQSIAGAAKKRLHVMLPVSPVPMEYMCHKKPAKMLEWISELVSHCVSLCEDVEFSALDATGSEREFLKEAVNVAVMAGAKTVTLCDQAGETLPGEFAAMVREVLAAMPEDRKATLLVQCADGCSMGLACSLAAMDAGADGIKTACASLAAPSSLLLSRIITARTDCGYCCGIKATEMSKRLQSIERMVSGKDGKRATPFDNGSGMEDENSIHLVSGAEIGEVAKAVALLGYDLSEEDLQKVYEAFVRVSEKKEVSGKELDAIVANVALQVPPTYQLVSYVINSGNILQATAHIVLEKDGKTMSGVCAGDGPIDAAFLTIEQIIGHHYELDDFRIQSVTEGREAVGEAIVKLRADGKLYSGSGISTDIIGASIRAYLSALNKIVYDENA